MLSFDHIPYSDGFANVYAPTGGRWPMASPALEIDAQPRTMRIVARRRRASWPRYHEQVCAPDHAVIAIALQAGQFELLVDGRPLEQGRVAAGAAYMALPGTASRLSFRSSCDVLQLRVPQARLDGILRAHHGGSDVALDRVRVSGADPTIERLAGTLLLADEAGDEPQALFLDGIAQAILVRLLDSEENQSETRRVRRLPKWRLKRVLDLIEADIAQPLRLADLARCAGLSRMHFAAQFRAAMGLRPHDYVTRRRVERSQDLLRRTDMPLAEIALAVGFQTQAHFTTVFRQLCGEPPGRWRRLQRLEAA